jgi:agmatine deiminase
VAQVFRCLFIMSSKKWFMPAEWQDHSCCWMLVPHRPDNWRNNALPGQHAFLRVAAAISKFEKVMLGVHPSIRESFSSLFYNEYAHIASGSDGVQFGVELFTVEYDDCWMRDVGPTFLINNSPQAYEYSIPVTADKHISRTLLMQAQAPVVAMDWIFNAWGEKYAFWGNDDKVASAAVDLLNLKRDINAPGR